mgnify:CR=1 FL=1
MAKYAIIGFGCAGYYGAKAIRENDKNSEIVVFSEHLAAPYNPMLTTYYVAGKIPYGEKAPEYMKEKHPDIFLSPDAPEELKRIYLLKKNQDLKLLNIMVIMN